MRSCASIESIRNASGCAVLSALVLAGVPKPSAAPLRLAIYYGYPSLVNGAQGNVEQAVTQFAHYDVIVFGAGLEFDRAISTPTAGPAEHAFTRRLMARLRLQPRQPQIFGYVDIGSTNRLSMASIVDRIERWAAMGAHGVLLDEAGFDFGVTRERQNRAVMSAHTRGLGVCLNAFRPEDLFGTEAVPTNAAGGGNPTGIAPVISARDAVLLESFAIRNGEAERPDRLARRVRAAQEGRARFGTRIFGVATSGADDGAALAQYGWWAAAAFGLDAYGWGTASYSAVTSRLPWIARPAAEATLVGAAFSGDVTLGDTRWSRATSLGRIVIDPRRLQGSFEPW